MTILRDHPTVTFKVKINGCYSGRFRTALKAERNLLTLETAANGSEYSWGALPRRFRHPDGRTIEVPEHANPGRSEFVERERRRPEAFFASAAEVAKAWTRAARCSPARSTAPSISAPAPTVPAAPG